MKKEIIIYLIIGLLFGFIIGVGYESGRTLNWCVQTGFKFLEMKGYELDVDKASMINAIMKYKGNIDGLQEKT